jgi:peptide methionine sulfoxide reductase msrA/msrB
MKYNPLNSEEKRVIVNKGTEMPYIGEYDKHYDQGIYLCKQCDTPLFASDDKFDSGCGWPAFDNAIEGAVKEITDSDGIRTEIICANCGGHLGHVFKGEEFTETNTRHCVNSISMNFTPTKIINEDSTIYETAIFAAGCFWGVEHHLKLAPGIISTDVGYTGGLKKDPTYKEICYSNTGHAEAVKVVFDPNITSYQEICKLFFEIHDPEQLNRQGPDVGDQYRSEIFYFSEKQKATAVKLIDILNNKGYKVVTKLTSASKFYKAENYHQDYYDKTGSNPYCHIYKKKF